MFGPRLYCLHAKLFPCLTPCNKHVQETWIDTARQYSRLYYMDFSLSSRFTHGKLYSVSTRQTGGRPHSKHKSNRSTNQTLRSSQPFVWFTSGLASFVCVCMWHTPTGRYASVVAEERVQTA